MDTRQEFTIYYDAYQEGQWFKGLSSQFSNSPVVPLLNRGKNPKIIESIIAYDRPDIVLAYGDDPILILERTEEVPSGHNVGQRFARMVKAAELGIPFVYFFPFIAQKHGKETMQRTALLKTNQRYTNRRLFDGISKLESIHDTLILPISWPVDSNFELLRTLDKDKEIRKVIHDYVLALLAGKAKCDIRNLPSIKDVKENVTQFIKSRIAQSKIYDLPPDSVKISKTSEVIDNYSITDTDVINHISARDKTVLYSIGMNYVRSDPYTGMLLFYDYLYARTGINPRDRKMNLACRFPNISIDTWNPLTSLSKLRKDVNIFSKFSDVIILKDGVALGSAA